MFNILIEYNVKKNMYKYKTNIKKVVIKAMLRDILASKVGLVVDNREPNRFDKYKINVSVDFTGDTFITNSNCGNKGLENGIIRDFFNRIDKFGDVK